MAGKQFHLEKFLHYYLSPSFDVWTVACLLMLFFGRTFSYPNTSGLTADANILIDHARVIAARHFFSERVDAICFSYGPVSGRTRVLPSKFR